MALNGWLGNTATWFLICVPDQPQQLSQNDELEWSLVTPFGGWKRIRRYISTTNDGNKNSLWIFFGRVFWFKSTHDFCIILSLLFPSGPIFHWWMWIGQVQQRYKKPNFQLIKGGSWKWKFWGHHKRSLFVEASLEELENIGKWWTRYDLYSGFRVLNIVSEVFIASKWEMLDHVGGWSTKCALHSKRRTSLHASGGGSW